MPPLSAVGIPRLKAGEDVNDLYARIHSGRYRASPVRRVSIPKPDRSQHALGILCLKISSDALLLVNYVPYDSHVWKTVNNAGSNDRLARVTPISHTSTALRKPPFLSAFQRLGDIRARVVKSRQPGSKYYGSKHHGADHGIEGPGNVDE